MLLEESVEVLHHVVAKDRGNCADLGARENAEQRLRVSESGFYLALNHCLVVFVEEDSLERSHLYPKFPCDGCQAQLHVAVRIEDEMAGSACGVLKERSVKTFSRRCPQCSYLSDDVLLDCRQLGRGAACHG